MYIYAQLDNNGYCIGISELGGEVEMPNMIKMSSYDESYIRRKYDLSTESWTDEYIQKDTQQVDTQSIWQQQVENAIGSLAEQVAKNTLLGGQ